MLMIGISRDFNTQNEFKVLYDDNNRDIFIKYGSNNYISELPATFRPAKTDSNIQELMDFIKVQYPECSIILYLNDKVYFAEVLQKENINFLALFNVDKRTKGFHNVINLPIIKL